MASKKRHKKSGSKKAARHGKKRPLSTWQRFMKSHKGMTSKKIAALYRAAGHGKKKTAKRGRKSAKKSRRSSSSVAPRSYANKFRAQLVKHYQEAGLSLTTAKKKASAVMEQEIDTGNINEAWKREFDLKKAELKNASDKARAARELKEIERLVREGDAEDERENAKRKREAEAQVKKNEREGKILAAQRRKLEIDRANIERRAAKYGASGQTSMPFSGSVS